MKKLLAFSLVLMLAFTLAACGGGMSSTNQADDSTNGTKQDNSKDSTKEIVKLILDGETRDLEFGPYKWRVLAVEDGKALLITEALIAILPYHTDLVDITWEACTLRDYLKNELLQSFTAEEQQRIINTMNTCDDNLWYEVPGGSDTQDKVFLLSLEEVDRYFGDSGDYQNEQRKDSIGNSENGGPYLSNAFDEDRKTGVGHDYYWWWLRSPGADSSRATYVNSDGMVLVRGSDVTHTGGVRPALWLDLK